MIILGIETSCDETSLALINQQKNLLAMATWSQTTDHRPFGGIVPEIAARAHLAKVIPLIEELLETAKMDKKNVAQKITAIAATTGPGLIGGLLVGATLGKAMALAWQKPFIAINHLCAHALSARLTNDLPFPYLILLISGGHCQLLAALGINDYRLYGETLDDSAGEAFDKGARLLGILHTAPSGGQAIEEQATHGNAKNFSLPVPMQYQTSKNNCDFSFSGLKTALKNKINNVTQETNNGTTEKQLPPKIIAAAAAALQSAIAQSLAMASARAMNIFRKDFPHLSTYHLAVVGGVAANKHIRQTLKHICQEQQFTLVAPPPKFCTDNAAMIAWAGLEIFQEKKINHLGIKVKPRWPIHPHIYNNSYNNVYNNIC